MQKHRLPFGSRCFCRKESINMTKKQKHLLTRIIVVTACIFCWTVFLWKTTPIGASSM